MSQQRKTYSFNSVGETSETYQKRTTVSQDVLPIGIKTPIAFFDNGSDMFNMNYTSLGQIKDNLKNLLNTNHGERILIPQFGANIMELCFEIGTEGGDTRIMARIKDAVSKYMPYVTLNGYEPIREISTSKDSTKTGLRLLYSVPSIGAEDQVIEVLLNISG